MSAGDGVPGVGVDEAARLRSSVVLLDVREGEEWQAGHAPWATHIPLADLPARVGELDPTRRLVCVCRSGNRSARATAWLRAREFDAVNMIGGMRAWADAGHAVCDDHARPGVVA